MATVISRRYEVLSKLGEGGMGVVYKVRHTSLEKILALKVLSSYLTENQEMVGRFSREGRVMARLSHRNIVRVIDSDRDDNLHYLVMEYIQGKTLKQYVYEKGPLSLPEVIEITHQVADALAYAHNHVPQVIHRDIKPANIMIEDDSGRAVVMDFGIAKELGESELTKTGVMVGTLKYCSPEQIQHEPLDGSADIYSLGMVIYEMYTGQQFFAGLDEHAVIGKVLYDPEDNVPRFTRSAPPAFIKLVTKAIAKHRQDRYQRVEELLRDLEACQSETEDDETATIILSTPEKREARGEPRGGEIADIEEQIRELEEEKRRRLLSTLQTEARQAREKAARDGAPERAAALFQEGLAAEESAGQRAREKDYTLAQEAYHEAIRLFNRADEEALAAAVVQKAEQERREMEAAKAEAERYNAREKGRTFYPRGLAQQAQADELWEQKNYQQAAEAYREARRFFDDARELAYREMVKEEAEAARAQTLIAKEAAESEAAGELAPEIFQEALLGERRAATAMEREEFTQARELYLAARQQYVAAQERAHRERQHQRALALQQEAKDARRQADEQEAQADCPAGYQKAAEAQQRGEQLLAAHEYAQAALEYAQAQSDYQQAGQEAEHARRRRAAERARQQAHEAQAHARQAGAQEHFAEAFAQTQRLIEQGQESEAREDFAPALSLYEQAAQRFAGLRQDAVLQAARAQAEAARQSMVEARAQSHALREWAETRWAEAHEWETRAEQAYQEQAYERATEGYGRARQLYERAQKEAERERLRREAQDAGQQAQVARAEAEKAEATQYAAELFRRGVAAQEEAEQRLQAEGFRQAVQRYRQASKLFAQAAEDARRERARQAAAAARLEAESAQEQARQAGAAARLGEEVARAQGLVEQGRACEARQDFAQAIGLYEQAAQRFAELRGEALVQVDRERAEAARQRTAKVKQGLGALTEWLGARWAEAQQQEAAAEQAWQARHYGRAAEQYAQAAQSYEAARTEAEEERLSQHALRTRRQVGQAQGSAEHAEALQYAQPLYQQALEAKRQGEQHFAAKRWEKAAAEFVRAAELFARTQRDARQEKERQTAVAAYQRAEQAQAAAKEAGVPARLGEEVAQAQGLVEQGRACEAQQDFGQAVGLYEQAARRFAELRDAVVLQAERERAAAARQRTVEVKQGLSALTEWLGVRWAEAQQQEAAAEQAWQGQQYRRAAKQYAQATQSYEAARTEAEEERLSQHALEAKGAAEQRRAAAEQGEAAQYAQTLYQQAIGVAERGQQRLAEKQWAEAAQEFAQAQEFFTRALQSAQREKTKQAVAAAYQRVERARTQAERIGAWERLGDEFAQAQRAAEQGRENEAREEFAEALKWYEQAAQRFAQLRREAGALAAREEAEAARQQMEQVRERVQPLRQWAEALWAEAQEWETRAEQTYQAQDYEQATEGYEQASQRYERVGEEGKRERERQAAAQARQQAESARAVAEAAEAARYAEGRFGRGTALLVEAARRESAAEFIEAAQGYRQAEALFHEAAEEARREQARRAAGAARQRMEAERAAAEEAGAQKRLVQEFAQAQTVAAHGYECEERQELTQAVTGYEEATRRFVQVRQEAVLQAERERAEAVRRRLEEMKQGLVELAEWAGAKWAEAQERGAEGEQAWQAQHYGQAAGHYEQAIRRYAEARGEAEEERQRQQALEAQRAAVRRRAAAEQGEAAHYAAALYQQATGVAERGAQRLAGKQWAEAAQAFTQAQELFDQALQSAQREKARQAAAAAREQTLVAQRDADTGTAFFPERVQEANALFLEASRAVAHEDYNAARAGFERSTALFLQIAQETVARLHKEQAEQARAQAQELRNKTLTAKGRQKKRADKAFAAGEHLFQQSQYAEAQASYAEATSLFAALQQPQEPKKSAVLPESPHPAAAREKAPLAFPVSPAYLLSGVALLAVVVYLIWRPAPPLDSSGKEETKIVQVAPPPSPPPIEGKAKPPVIPPPQESPRVEERPPVPSPVTEPKNQEEPPPSPPQERVQVTPSPQPEPLAPDPPQALVKVVPPPELEPPVLKPPLITQAVPEATVEVAVAEGERLAFAVDAQSAQQSPLRYTWLLDGKKQAEGKKWTYRPDFDEGGEKPKEVKAVVTDGKAAPVEKTWQVRVQDVNRPPVITGASPKAGPVEISASEQRSFAIQAADPDKEDRLTYVWSLDGQEVARGNSASWQLPASAAEAAHKVTVDVVDKAGKSKQAVWNVTKPSPSPVLAAVQPREKEVPPPLPPPREPPKVDGPEKKIEVTEKEIQDWLESYRQAWEDRNIPALVKLGAISSQEASDLQRIFAQYPRDFRVALKEVENRGEGKQAKVAFTQVDIFDGKPRPHPRPKIFTLEKETDGHIIGRR